jgi:hypothetical protein
MEDRFADAARDFWRSHEARSSARAMIYAVAAGQGGWIVRALRGLRSFIRLAPPRLPEARLPAGRQGR